MAERNIDAAYHRQRWYCTKKLSKGEYLSIEWLYLLCELRGYLIREINGILAFDYVLIESTGITEPHHVAERF